MMDSHLQHGTTLNIKFAHALVEDLSLEQMVAQPNGERTLNHPAWVLGHLSVYNSTAAQLLGGPSLCPQTWEPLFGMGSKPQSSTQGYPSKQELLDAFASSSSAAMEILLNASEDARQVAAPEAMRAFFPTVGDYALYDLTAHAGFHLGQVSAWRRAMGMASLF